MTTSNSIEDVVIEGIFKEVAMAEVIVILVLMDRALLEEGEEATSTVVDIIMIIRISSSNDPEIISIIEVKIKTSIKTTKTETRITKGVISEIILIKKIIEEALFLGNKGTSKNKTMMKVTIPNKIIKTSSQIIRTDNLPCNHCVSCVFKR